MLMDRLVHSCRFKIQARGCSGSLRFDHNSHKWILEAGTYISKTYVSSFTDYGNIFKLRDSAYKNGYIDNDILKREIEFKSLSAATQFVLMRPNCYSGVFHYDYKIALKKLLEDPWLYNKYIAHCEYYDKDWNVIGNTATQEQSDVCTEGEIEEVPINIEDSLEGMEETELESFSTIEIINELLARLSKIGGEA